MLCAVHSNNDLTPNGHNLMKHFSQIILSLLLIVHTAHACPLVNGLVDFNCDQKLRYVITGDSIVAGLGDAQNNNVGGYVKRVRPLLPTGTRVIPIGISGIRSDQLLRKFRGKEFWFILESSL